MELLSVIIDGKAGSEKLLRSPAFKGWPAEPVVFNVNFGGVVD